MCEFFSFLVAFWKTPGPPVAITKDYFTNYLIVLTDLLRDRVNER